MDILKILGIAAAGYVIGRVHQSAIVIKKIENGDLIVKGQQLQGFTPDFQIQKPKTTEGGFQSFI